MVGTVPSNGMCAGALFRWEWKLYAWGNPYLSLAWLVLTLLSCSFNSGVHIKFELFVCLFNSHQLISGGVFFSFFFCISTLFLIWGIHHHWVLTAHIVPFLRTKTPLDSSSWYLYIFIHTFHYLIKPNQTKLHSEAENLKVVFYNRTSRACPVQAVRFAAFSYLSLFLVTMSASELFQTTIEKLATLPPTENPYLFAGQMLERIVYPQLHPVVFGFLIFFAIIHATIIICCISVIIIPFRSGREGRRKNLWLYHRRYVAQCESPHNTPLHPFTSLCDLGTGLDIENDQWLNPYIHIFT